MVINKLSSFLDNMSLEEPRKSNLWEEKQPAKIFAIEDEDVEAFIQDYSSSDDSSQFDGFHGGFIQEYSSSDDSSPFDGFHGGFIQEYSSSDDSSPFDGFDGDSIQEYSSIDDSSPFDGFDGESYQEYSSSDDSNPFDGFDGDSIQEYSSSDSNPFDGFDGDFIQDYSSSDDSNPFDGFHGVDDDQMVRDQTQGPEGLSYQSPRRRSGKEPKSPSQRQRWKADSVAAKVARVPAMSEADQGRSKRICRHPDQRLEQAVKTIVDLAKQLLREAEGKVVEYNQMVQSARAVAAIAKVNFEEVEVEIINKGGRLALAERSRKRK